MWKEPERLILIQVDKIKIKQLVEDFTSKTFGAEIPTGLCFSTCFPLSILLDIHQIKNRICCGDYPLNAGLVTHVWLEIDDEGTILDPTIRQFDATMEATYIGKLSDNTVTSKYLSDKRTFQQWFKSSYDVWTEPLIDKRPRIYERPVGFEERMNLFNVKSASVLYNYIDKIPQKELFMQRNKSKDYFYPIIKFLREKSNADENFLDSVSKLMPEEFNLLLRFVTLKTQ